MIAPGWAPPIARRSIVAVPGRDQSTVSTSHWIVVNPSDRASEISAALTAPYGARNRHGVKPWVADRIAAAAASIWPRANAAGAGDVRVAPGVIADHVAVGEHPPFDRAALAVGRDLLADLEERGRHVVALEDVQELGRVVPRAVVERQRDLAAGRRARC